MTNKKLIINHVFGCVGRENFLINLKIKATGRLVDAIVKTAFGAICSSMPMEIQQPGEKFVPAKSSKKRLRRKNVQATIERAAAQIFKNSNNEQALLLGREGECDIYSYDNSIGLVLDPEGGINKDLGSAEGGAPYMTSNGADYVDVDVGCEVAASLEVCPKLPEPGGTTCLPTRVSTCSFSSSSTSDDLKEPEKAVATLSVPELPNAFNSLAAMRAPSPRRVAFNKVTIFLLTHFSRGMSFRRCKQGYT